MLLWLPSEQPLCLVVRSSVHWGNGEVQTPGLHSQAAQDTIVPDPCFYPNHVPHHWGRGRRLWQGCWMSAAMLAHIGRSMGIIFKSVFPKRQKMN